MVNDLISFIAPLSPDISPELHDFLDELSAVQDGAWLTVTVEKTRAQIEELIEALVEYY